MKRKKIFKRHNYRCWYCGCPLNDCYGPPTIDHKVPVSRGGGNSVRNIVAACPACNHLKDDMTVYEFRRALDSPIFRGDYKNMIGSEHKRCRYQSGSIDPHVPVDTRSDYSVFDISKIEDEKREFVRGWGIECSDKESVGRLDWMIREKVWNLSCVDRESIRLVHKHRVQQTV